MPRAKSQPPPQQWEEQAAKAAPGTPSVETQCTTRSLSQRPEENPNSGESSTSLFRINVREEDFGFALFNYDQICGQRMWRGENPKRREEIWPFKRTENDWMYYETRAEAETAAQKLQTYLDARSRSITKSRQKKTEE